MEDDRDPIQIGQQVDVLGCGDRTGNRRPLVLIAQPLAGKEGRPSVRELDDYR